MLMNNENDPKQIRFGILNAYNFWDETIKPNWILFENIPTSRTAFNLAISLWSVIEWIFHDPAHGVTGLTKKQLEKQFESQCPSLSIVHDLCTHGKHYTVSKPRSTVNAIDPGDPNGAVICFSSPVGPISEQTCDFVVHLEDGTQIPLQQVFREAISFWQQYFSMPRS